MKVRAKWNIGYKKEGYKCGDVFEMEDKDYPKFQNDVVIFEDYRKAHTKPVNKSASKSEQKRVAEMKKASDKSKK